MINLATYKDLPNTYSSTRNVFAQHFSNPTKRLSIVSILTNSCRFRFSTVLTRQSLFSVSPSQDGFFGSYACARADSGLVSARAKTCRFRRFQQKKCPKSTKSVLSILLILDRFERFCLTMRTNRRAIHSLVLKRGCLW